MENILQELLETINQTQMTSLENNVQLPTSLFGMKTTLDNVQRRAYNDRRGLKPTPIFGLIDESIAPLIASAVTRVSIVSELDIANPLVNKNIMIKNNPRTLIKENNFCGKFNIVINYLIKKNVRLRFDTTYIMTNGEVCSETFLSDCFVVHAHNKRKSRAKTAIGYPKIIQVNPASGSYAETTKVWILVENLEDNTVLTINGELAYPKRIGKEILEYDFYPITGDEYRTNSIRKLSIFRPGTTDFSSDSTFNYTESNPNWFSS